MNEKVVNLGGKEVKLSTSSYIVILYSELFNDNIFAEMNDIILAARDSGKIPFEKLEVLYKLTYAMAKHSDNDIPPIKEWLRQFDVYAIPEIAGDLIELWTAENEQQSVPKLEAGA